MTLGISPVEELKKKVELLSSKLDSLSQLSPVGLTERLEEVEDLQLLEKLNSIEMREELQNLRTELETVGVKTSEPKSENRSDIESRIQDIESKLQEVEILSSGGNKEKVDWDSIKEDIISQVQSKIKIPTSNGTIDTDDIEQNILKKVEQKITTLKLSQPSNSTQVDSSSLEQNILQSIDQKLDLKIKSLKPGMLSSIFSKAPQIDLSEVKVSIKTELQNEFKGNVKTELKGELLSDIRTMITQEVSEFPTAGVTKGELKIKLAQFKTELIDSLGIEKSIDKKLVPVLRSFENLDSRFSKTDSQLTTLFSTLPREIKLIKDDVNIRIETHDKTLDQVRRELKELRLGGIEGYQYLATKEEARRVADEKVNQLRNEILANKLAGEDEKYDEVLSRVVSLDDRFTILKSELAPTIERLSDVDRLASKLTAVEADLNSFVHDRLMQIDPDLFKTVVTTVDQLRQRIDILDKEPNEYVKRSLDSIRLMQDRDRESNEKIAQFVHLETERMSTLNDDIKSTVISKLEDFERRIPPEDVWIEVESLRSRLSALERNQKEMNMGIKRKAIAQPAIIE